MHSVFSHSVPGVSESCLGISLSKSACDSQSALVWASVACTCCSSQRIYATFDLTSVCSLVDVLRDSFNLRWSCKLRSAICRTSKPLSGIDSPIRLIKLLLLFTTLRCCSRSEDRLPSISPKSQLPSSSPVEVGSYTKTPPGTSLVALHSTLFES